MATLFGMSLYFWLCCILFGVVILLIIHFYIIYTHLNQIPAPPYIPILGHLLDYADPEEGLKKITRSLIKYGGIIRLYIGPRKPSIAVASKEFIKFLCQNKKYVGKAKFYQYLKGWLGEGLITSDGDKWLSRRKALTASFTSTSVLRSFIEIFEEKTEVLIDVLEKLDNQNVDMHPIMKKFTADVIYETAMGFPLNSQKQLTNSTYATSIETICDMVQRRMVSATKQFDFFYHFTKDYQEEKSALRVIDRVLEDIIKNKKKEKGAQNFNNNKDLLDSMMELHIDGKRMSSSDLREEVNTFLFAGYDTTSSAMALALYELAQNSAIQKKVLMEQRMLMEQSNNTKITYELLNNMKYLEMVIKETLRLHTIVPAVGRKVKKDLQFGHIKIPENLNISVCLHALHHNPNYFPEPEKFIPERFADENKIDEFTYLPFGVQPRQCLGKNFAMLEMKTAISKIIRHFEVLKIPGKKLTLKPKLVLYPSSGIWISIRKRHQQSI
ncbi:cytochrome P450 4d2-like [Anthonomus grandis grandis]|uniref:cytochrome P450 4d2-like n=1 Tax=Anthonomus grandis grandis TaxID=2921223 RepID=UPI00216597E4|nr:cytochrome P450 4d2-like [Anthonomus grandis grandis]